MSDLEARKKILQALYETMRKYGGRPSGYKIDDLADDLGIDKNDARFHVRYLVKRNFVRSVVMGSVEIETAGIDFVEGPSEFNPPAQYNQQVISISGGQVGQVNQAHIINNPSLFLNRLADELERSPDLDPEKKKSWTETLRDLANSPLIEKIVSAALRFLGWDTR